MFFVLRCLHSLFPDLFARCKEENTVFVVWKVAFFSVHRLRRCIIIGSDDEINDMGASVVVGCYEYIIGVK